MERNASDPSLEGIAQERCASIASALFGIIDPDSGPEKTKCLFKHILDFDKSFITLLLVIDSNAKKYSGKG